MYANIDSAKQKFKQKSKGEKQQRFFCWQLAYTNIVSGYKLGARVIGDVENKTQTKVVESEASKKKNSSLNAGSAVWQLGKWEWWTTGEQRWHNKCHNYDELHAAAVCNERGAKREWQLKRSY